jgi:GDP-D-mannose 3', 5'-epimerase
MTRVLVTGAGGFIGHHLVKYLRERNCWVRGVDVKYPEFERTSANEFYLRDLRWRDLCWEVLDGSFDEVYGLAADMGGIGYIETHKADIMFNNTAINFNMIDVASKSFVKKYLFTSSACVYPQHCQNFDNAPPLKEEDAYPADPEDGYGWEKLYTERLCRHYREERGLDTRIVRFHNIYGPMGTYEGGKEKSPAAICRKIAKVQSPDESIEVWGDGEQTRSYCYIDDCVEGVYRLMQSDYHDPLNLGTDRMVSINQLVDIVASVAGKSVVKSYYLDRPLGVRSRNSDNTKLKQVLGWEPQTTLEEGLKKTYSWINSQINGSVH